MKFYSALVMINEKQEKNMKSGLTLEEFNKKITLYLHGREAESIADLLEEGIELIEGAMANQSADPRSRVESFHAQDIARRTIESLTPLLYKLNLMERYYEIYPNPAVFSRTILNAFYDDARNSNMPLARRAIELGGIIVAKDLSSTDFKLNKAPPVDIVESLFKNIKENNWAAATLGSESIYSSSHQRFYTVLLSSLFRSKPYRAVVMTQKDPEFFNSFVGDGVFSNGRNPGVLKYMIYEQCSTNLLLAIHKYSKDLYRIILDDMQVVSRLQGDVAYRHNVDLSRLPSHTNISSTFCINAFCTGMHSLTLSDENYKGMLKHWSLSGEGEKLHKKVSRRKHITSLIECYREYVLAISKSDCDLAEISVRKNNRFLGNLELFEKIYIKPENRISSNPIAIQNHIIFALNNGDDEDCNRICDTYAEQMTSRRVVDELLRLSAKAPNGYKSEKFDKHIHKMIADKETRGAFSHISKKTYDEVFSSWNKIGLKVLKTIRWQDPEIKKSWISSDMEI